VSLSSRAAGLSPGMKVFLLVDVVLVLALVVVAALVLTGTLSGGGGSTDSGSDVDPSVSQPAATPTPSGSAAPTGVESFATQSRNIACTMRDDGVTCTIASTTFVPPGAESCSGTMGHVVEATADGVEVPCVDGPAPGPAAEDVPVLDYGLTSTVGGWTCTSATNGVTCVEDATGAGFRLARAELVEVG
jgi:hypothetical protein